MREPTITEQAAFAADELIEKVDELRKAAEWCADDEYWALIDFYTARNDVFRLIPSCEELIVTDFTEELKGFVDENAGALFVDWQVAGYEPRDLYITEEVAAEYRRYLEETADDGDDE